MGLRQVWVDIIKKNSELHEDGWWNTKRNVVMEVATALENVDYGQNGPPVFNTAKAKLESDDYIVLYRPSGGIFESRTETVTYIPWGQIRYIRFRTY